MFPGISLSLFVARLSLSSALSASVIREHLILRASEPSRTLPESVGSRPGLTGRTACSPVPRSAELSYLHIFRCVSAWGMSAHRLVGVAQSGVDRGTQRPPRWVPRTRQSRAGWRTTLDYIWTIMSDKILHEEMHGKKLNVDEWNLWINLFILNFLAF